MKIVKNDAPEPEHEHSEEFEKMGKSALKYALGALMAVVAIIAAVALFYHASPASAELSDTLNKGGRTPVLDAQDRPMSKADIAEQQRIEAEKEAARIAEEQRIAAEKAAQQAAAEEAERKAREAASTTISSTPGEGDYSDVLMVGDSIMVVSSWSLNDYLPGVTIDACSARSLEYGGVAEGSGPGDGVLDHIRALDTSQYSRYVVGTGNNDGGGMDIESGEEIVALLAGHEVWFVTEYVTNNSNGTETTNSTIDELCSKYPNVHKVDWYSVASANRADFLGSDNCHPQNQAATNAYAGLVKSALDF